jgi:hypothetical protein
MRNSDGVAFSSSRGREHKMNELSHREAQYDAFLFTALCEDDEISLTVLSLLARQDFDPRQEAARLAQLSKEQAINSLASKIWKSDSERWSPSGASILATRLIELLPSHRSHSSSPVPERPSTGLMLWVVIGMLLGSIAVSGNTMQNSVQHASAPAAHTSVVVQQDALPGPSNEAGRD